MDPLRCSRRARSRSSAPTTAPAPTRDNVAAQPRARRVRRARLGRQPEARPRSTGAPACRRVAELPGAGRRGRGRDPGGGGAGRRSREAGERGCGGAIVLSAGFGEVESGRELEARAARGRARRDAAGLRPERQRDRRGRRAARRCGATRSRGARARARVAMISQSGNVAVNALGSRRGIGFHTVVSTGNQAVCDASDWLAALAARDGVRSVAMFLEADGDGAELAEALALLRRARRRRRRAQGRRLGGRAARRRRPHRRAGRRPARLPGAGRGGRRRLGRDPHELLELARVLAEPRARPARRRRPRGAHLLGRRLRASPADEAERLGVELPQLAPATRERLAELLPGRGDDRQPARLHGDDLGRRRAAAPRSSRRSAPTPRSTSCCSATTTRTTAGRAALGGGAARARSTARRRRRRRARWSPRPSRPDRPRRPASSPDAGVPASPGLRTALAARGRCGPRPGTRPACARSRRRAGAPRRRPRRRRTDGWARPRRRRMLRDAGVAVPAGRVVDDAEDAVAARGEIGCPVALKLSGPDLRTRASSARSRSALDDEGRAARGVRAAGRDCPAAPARGCSSSGWPRRASSCWSPRGADGVVPALVVGLGGIWAEALDDVASCRCRPMPERVERALRSLRGAPLLFGGTWARRSTSRELAEPPRRVGELLLERAPLPGGAQPRDRHAADAGRWRRRRLVASRH